MTNRTSPLDQANDYFPFNGKPLAISAFKLVSVLNEAHALATGARAVSKLIANSITESCDDEGKTLTPGTVEGLLGLVGLASSQFLVSLELAMQEETPHG